MDEYKKANLALWNEWTALHARSDFYDVAGFKAGKTSLNPLEMEELGNVAGKTLLHLQCHFGLDSLSWARLGARVTGVDFSDQAIALARSLSQEVGVEAEFVCSDVYELPQVLAGQFDIVYTSYGVLAWLPDLRKWATVIAQFLKPGGIFYMAEFHPFAMVFDNSETATGLRLQYPYFHTAEPMVFDVQGSYIDRQAQVTQKVEYEWDHSLGEILDALIAAGLRLEFLHEFSYCTYAMFPSLMEQCSDGMWRLKEGDGSIPLMFSIKASK
jgi:2-polyprenyl-3-methyl-5-hydroxy-6-metoxy-1,4-benzoquinol methylase